MGNSQQSVRGRLYLKKTAMTIIYVESDKAFPGAATGPLEGIFTGVALKYPNVLPEPYQGCLKTANATYSGVWNVVVMPDSSRQCFLKQGTVRSGTQTRIVSQTVAPNGSISYSQPTKVIEGTRTWTYFPEGICVLTDGSRRLFHEADPLGAVKGPVVEIDDATGERLECHYDADSQRHGVATRYYPSGDTRKEKWHRGTLLAGEV
jgi:hypothetical protein